MSSPDPLELLQQYTTAQKPIELLDAEGNLADDLLKTTTVRFGEDASFPRDTPTTYSRGNNETDLYTLSALIHFLAHRDQSFYEYMKTSNTMGLQSVSFGDRSHLVDYLTGKAPKKTTTQSTSMDVVDEKQNEQKRAKNRLGGDKKQSTGTANDIARDIIRRERTLVTPSSALGSNKSFARVPDLVRDLLPAKKHAKTTTAEADTATAAAEPTKANKRQRRRDHPIIVVPAATTAMLNMYNIKQLLQDHQLADGRAVMEQGGPKPRECFVEHTMKGGSGKTVKFKVVDAVQDFSETDWNSVVCVFTQGAAWQFKNWVWKSPQEVFQHCLGYYSKYQDERPKDSVSSWNLKMLNFDRNKRHMDRAVVASLWVELEQYMARSKPEFIQ